MTPDKVVDVQALAGDSTDNVPGVPGIGVKTAAELINTYGDLDTLLASAGEISNELFAMPSAHEPCNRSTGLASARSLQDDCPPEWPDGCRGGSCDEDSFLGSRKEIFTAAACAAACQETMACVWYAHDGKECDLFDATCFAEPRSGFRTCRVVNPTPLDAYLAPPATRSISAYL